MADHDAHPPGHRAQLSEMLDRHPFIRELIDSVVWLVEQIDAMFGRILGDSLGDWLLDELAAALKGRDSSAGPRPATWPGRRSTST